MLFSYFFYHLYIFCNGGYLTITFHFFFINFIISNQFFVNYIIFFSIYYIRPVIQLRLNNERAFTVVTLRKWRVRLDFIIIKTDSFELFSSSAYKEWRDDEHTMTKHITPDKRFLRFFTFFCSPWCLWRMSSESIKHKQQ